MFFVYDSTLQRAARPLVAGPAAGGRPRRRPVPQRSTSCRRCSSSLGVPAPATSGVSRAAVLQPGGRIRDNESYAESLYAQLHFGYAPAARAARRGLEAHRRAAGRALPRWPRTPARRGTSSTRARRSPAAMRTRLAALRQGTPARAPELPALDADAAERLAALGYVGGGRVRGRARPRASTPRTGSRELQAYQRDMRVGAARLPRRDLDGGGPGPRARRASRGRRRSTSSTTSAAASSSCGASPRRSRTSSSAAEMAPTRHTLSGLAAAPIYAASSRRTRRPASRRRRSRRSSKALEVAPANAELLRPRGSLLLRQGDLAGARAALEKARATDAREPRLHVELAELLPQHGRPRRKAEAAAKEAVRLDPKSADAQLACGLVLGALGRDAEAARALREARAPLARAPRRALLPRARSSCAPGAPGRGAAPREAREAGARLPARPRGAGGGAEDGRGARAGPASP